MAIPRVTNRETREHVQNMRVFKNHNKTLWGEWYEQGIPETGEIVKRYVVYSYRYNWPLFVAEHDPNSDEWRWYENIDRYSLTTSRHKSQSHPRIPTMPMTVGAMNRIVREGIVGLVARGEVQ